MAGVWFGHLAHPHCVQQLGLSSVRVRERVRVECGSLAAHSHAAAQHCLSTASLIQLLFAAALALLQLAHDWTHARLVQALRLRDLLDDSVDLATSLLVLAAVRQLDRLLDGLGTLHSEVVLHDLPVLLDIVEALVFVDQMEFKGR